MTNPDGATLGRARGYIDLDTSGVRTAIADAKNQISGFIGSAGGQLTQWGDQMSNIGGQMTAMFAPLGIGMAAGINMASKFDSSLAEIQARAGLTDEALEEIRATALQLGADTAFSTQQATDAFLNLLTAGLSTEQALATLPAVLTGAAAAGADLGQTADQVTNIMSSFQIEAAEAERIIEAMSRAAGASPAEMSEMGEALTLIGGDARAFGLSLDQTSAALAILAKNGKRGSEAANQLKSMFTAMTSGTTDNKKAWDMVNSSMFDASGNARDFSVVLAEVEVGLQNLSAEDQAFVIQNLAGSYGRVGFQALLASDGIDAMIGEMGEQASAAEVAEARLDTFEGRVESMKGSVESFGITVLTPFMNTILKPLIEWVTGVINIMTAWASTHPELVQNIMSFIAVLVAVGPTLFVVGKAIAFVGFMLTTLTSPIGIVLALVAALGAAWVTNFMGIRNSVQPIIENLISRFRVIAAWFKELGAAKGFQRLFTTFEDGSNAVGGLFRAFGMSEKAAYRLGNIINRIVRPAIDWIIKGFNLVRAAITIFMGNIPDGWSILTAMGLDSGQTWSIILGITRAVKFLQSAFETFMGIVTPIFDAFNNTFRVFFTTLEGGGSLFDSLSAAFMTFAATIHNALAGIDWAQVGQTILQGLGSALSALADLAAWAYNNLILPIFNSVKTAFENIQWGEVGTSILNGIGAALSVALAVATWAYNNILLPLFNNLKTAISNVNWGEVGTSILNAIGTALTTMGSWATWIFTNILKPIWDNVATAIALIDWGQVGLNILSAIGTALSLAADFVGWVYDNILLPLFNNAKLAIEQIDWYQFGADVVNAIGSALKTTFDFIGWIIDSIFSPITTNTDAATGAVDWAGVGTSIMNAIKGAIVGLFNFVTWLNETIFTPMINGASTAISQLNWASIGSGIMSAIARALPNIITWVNTNIITPIRNALSGFNPMSAFSMSTPQIPAAGTWTTPNGGFGASGGAPAPQPHGGGFFSGIKTIFGLASGTNYVPQDMIAMLHEGEEVRPKEYNPAAGGNAGGMFAGANINIYANSEEEGREAYRGFHSEFMEEMKASGN